ncbi:hypothetical protein H2248_012340 [Termitomyces sp. 'cryptogamus']|nr:hypothetical protein H2248_012340 [Termitomyces sp. 'cryptogamus']
MAMDYHQNHHTLAPFISSYKAVQAELPIHNVPIEVLIKIFLSIHCDNVYDRWEIHPSRDRPLPRTSLHQESFLDLMILAQVCGQWRKVALSTPLLWSSINILCSDKKQLVPLLNERSETCPLNTRFNEYVSGSGADKTDPDVSLRKPLTADIMSLLVDQTQRWKTIDLTLSRQLPAVLSRISPGSLPLLDTVSIMSRDATNENFCGMASLEKVWQVIHSSTSLRSGRWELEYVENHLDGIPWAQLTTIDITMSLESLIKILPLFYNLVELRYTDPLAVYHPNALSLRVQSSDECHSDSRIVLPEVRSIVLRMYQPVNTVLDCLTLPALLSYDVQVCKGDTERSHISSLRDLLTRSGCHLEVFTYDNLEPEAEDTIAEILSFPQLSSLVTLDVRHRTTDKLIGLLKRTSHERSILPRLKQLFLGPCSTRSGALSGMALSRQSIIDEIASLRILEVGRWDCHPLDLECFQVLSDEGMYIRI